MIIAFFWLTLHESSFAVFVVKQIRVTWRSQLQNSSVNVSKCFEHAFIYIHLLQSVSHSELFVLYFKCLCIGGFV